MSKRRSNVVEIGAALDAPVDAPQLGAAGPETAAGDDDEGDFRRPLLPSSSPVRALGMKEQICFYLDVKGQLIALGPRDHGKNNVIALFSPRTHLPTQYWPQWSAEKKDRRTNEVLVPSRIVGFDQAQASEALIGACGEAGIFDVEGKLRSRGAHLGRDGALIVHCGDGIHVGGGRRIDGTVRAAAWHQPGLIDGFVYPAHAPTPRPVPDAVGEDAGEELLGILQTWRWKRDILDPMLLLGWIGQSFLCGAPEWRSHLFVTGGAGTGKSTLNGKNGLCDRLLGAGLLRTASATEAAVRQRLGAQTVPVIFDEFEAGEFNLAKTKAMVELARVASSGDDMHKGGQDHQARQFVMRSAFMFSAILMPEMQPQDRSRFAILELLPFPAPPALRDGEDGEARPDAGIDLDRLKLPELGRRLMRRMIDGWPRFDETLRLYKRALERVGHVPRGQMMFGTLLTAADLLLYDHVPDRGLADDMARHCAPETLAEIANMTEEHDACLNHLAFAQVQARGGDERATVASWIGAAYRPAEGDTTAKFDRQLEHLGLRVVRLRTTKTGKAGVASWLPGSVEDAFLAIAGDHAGIAGIYRDSRWQRGAWAQALARVPGAVGSVVVKFDGRPLRTTLVPIDAVIGSEGDEA